MTWVRLDDQFCQHPKVITVGPLGVAMQVAGLCYCNRFLTDGFIPTAAIGTLLDFTELDEHAFNGHGDVCWIAVTKLTDAGMWEIVDGGYMIHDYLDYQPSKLQVQIEHDRKRAAGQAGGLARAKQVLKQNPSKVVATLSSTPNPRGISDADPNPQSGKMGHSPGGQAQTQAGALAEFKQVPSTSLSRIQAESKPKPKPKPKPVPQTELSSSTEDDHPLKEKVFSYPEWFTPLTTLRGFKNTAHLWSIKSIQEGCEESEANISAVVQAFADYYRDGGRATNGWTDPVAALRKTLPIQISKSRNGPRLQNRRAPSNTGHDDYLKAADEADAARAAWGKG